MFQLVLRKQFNKLKMFHVWIQQPLFTGESYCWTIKHFDVWLEEIGVIDGLLQGQGYIFAPFSFWQSMYSSIGHTSISVPPFTYMIYYNVLVNLIFFSEKQILKRNKPFSNLFIIIEIGILTFFWLVRNNIWTKLSLCFQYNKRYHGSSRSGIIDL